MTNIDEILNRIKTVDKSGMLDCVLQFPAHLLESLDSVSNLARKPNPGGRVHLFGMGGSAIAGDVVSDLIYPGQSIVVHRGDVPPADEENSLIAASSYSGNTEEITSQAKHIAERADSVFFLTSGGLLKEIGNETKVPVLKMPGGFQPRAVLGWSMGLLIAVMVKTGKAEEKLLDEIRSACSGFQSAICGEKLDDSEQFQAAFKIAESIAGRNVLIWYDAPCRGAGLRFAAQLCENAKTPAFTAPLPEAYHNTIEGMGGADGSQWAVVTLSDSDSKIETSQAFRKAPEVLESNEVAHVQFPDIGHGQIERVLNRILIGDLISVMVAGLKGVDPTPIPTITKLKG